MHLGDDGLAVGRRCGYHRQVARAHERELQRARYGRCRKRERIDIDAHLAEFLLGCHAELLLLVYYEQPQIVETDLFAEHLVRADEYVDLACSQILGYLAGLFGAFRAVEILDAYGEIAQALHE